jgi:hypothetical protein
MSFTPAPPQISVQIRIENCVLHFDVDFHCADCQNVEKIAVDVLMVGAKMVLSYSFAVVLAKNSNKIFKFLCEITRMCLFFLTNKKISTDQ